MVEVMGFSRSTCFPFSKAFFANEKCVNTGVAITTASISFDNKISSGSVLTLIPGYVLETMTKRSWRKSETILTLQLFTSEKFLTKFVPQ